MKIEHVEQISVTALIVGLNESELLEKCIKSVSFCEKVIYFDLHSEDNSLSIAKRMGADTHQYERVPFVELVHANVVPKIHSDWVLFIDPDEIVSEGLKTDLISIFSEIQSDPTVCSVRVPWRFYFKGIPLRGTAWGGANSKVVMVNKNNFIFTPQVHTGRNCKEGFIEKVISDNGTNILEHYWMTSWEKLFKKHLRYLRGEGQARMNINSRISLLDFVSQPFRAFYYSYFAQRGYRDGLTGFALSVFWASYQSLAEVFHAKTVINNYFKQRGSKNKQT